VFVHGLFGHPEKTWTAELPLRKSNFLTKISTNNPDETDGRDFDDRKKAFDIRRFLLPMRLSGTSDTMSGDQITAGSSASALKDIETKCFWPRDLLPKLFPAVRIMTWGYDADINKPFSSASSSSVLQHAEMLLMDLVNARQKDRFKRAPIIFIVHSLGGIVIKDAIFRAAYHHPYAKELFPAIEGVIFLGTPHRGSDTASWGKIAFGVSKIFLQNPNVGLLRSLESNSDILERISQQFVSIVEDNSIFSRAKRLKIHSFSEELPYHGVTIVPSTSAFMGIPYENKGSLYANHRTMARFTSLHEVNFQRIASVLARWLGSIVDRLQHPEDERLGIDYDACLRSLNVSEARLRLQEVDRPYKGTDSWIFNTEIGLTNFSVVVKSPPHIGFKAFLEVENQLQ
jgi:hypothetical protein